MRSGANGVALFWQSELNYLTKVMAAGSLEATLSPDPIAINTMGPSIGADNLKAGTNAFIVAIIAVAVFMILYYFFAGAVAGIALLINGVIIFGVMSLIDGTFTLPGNMTRVSNRIMPNMIGISVPTSEMPVSAKALLSIETPVSDTSMSGCWVSIC